MNKLIALILLLIPLVTSAFPGTPITPPDTLNSCDTLWLKSGKIMVCTILSDDGKEIKFTDCPPSDIISTIPKQATKLSPSDSIRKANLVLACDTIYLKDGEVVTGWVKYVTKRKVVYVGCCEECKTEKIIKMEAVSSVSRSGGQQTQPTVQTKPTTPTVVYSEDEKRDFGKKKKLFGILALTAGGLATSSILIMALFTAATFSVTMLLGVLAFVFVIVGLAMFATRLN